MKVYVVRNQYLPPNGQQSVLLTVNPEGQSLVATLLYSQFIADQPDETIVLGGKTWHVRDRLTINFSDLQNRREFADRTTFFVGLDWAANRWAQKLIPLFTVSVDTKLSPVDLVQTNMVPSLVVGFNVPYATSSFSECDITVNIPSVAGEVYVEGIDAANVIQSPYSTSGMVREINIFPHLSATGPASATAGSDIEFLVRVVDANGTPLNRDVTLYLENVNGYLPKNRVQTSGGQATVKMMTVGLDAGDKVRLKAGFKFYSGAADAEVLLT